MLPRHRRLCLLPGATGVTLSHHADLPGDSHGLEPLRRVRLLLYRPALPRAPRTLSFVCAPATAPDAIPNPRVSILLGCSGAGPPSPGRSATEQQRGTPAAG